LDLFLRKQEILVTFARKALLGMKNSRSNEMICVLQRPDVIEETDENAK